MTDYPKSRAGAALGARLRRLSAAIDADTGRIYAQLGVTFEQRWFGVMNQLVQGGPSTVGDIAAALRISHASVSQARDSLEGVGLVASEPDPADGRRRRLVLTKAGEDLAAQMAPLWQTLEAVSEELNAEAGDVVAALDRLEAALGERSLAVRIRARMAG